MPKNRELVYNQAVDKFKENLKYVIADGAVLLSVDELAKVVDEVSKEMLSFLDSDASGKKSDK